MRTKRRVCLAKILHEAGKRRKRILLIVALSTNSAVMIPGNGKNYRLVMLVRLVKLLVVMRGHAVVIYDISKVIEKAWLVLIRCLVKLLFHCFCDLKLGTGIVDVAGIPHCVKHKFIIFLDPLIHLPSDSKKREIEVGDIA